MQNADISVPKYTYIVDYWHISTIISVHISEQQHFYRYCPFLFTASFDPPESLGVSFDIHQLRYIIFDIMQ